MNMQTDQEDPEPRTTHTVNDEEIPGFILRPGEEDTTFQLITRSGSNVCLSGAALSELAGHRRESANHRVWEISGLGPHGPEAMDALLRIVNRYIQEEELGDPIPAGHRGWDEERTIQFLDMARDELRWKSSAVELPMWGGHEALWSEIKKEYPLVFQQR